MNKTASTAKTHPATRPENKAYLEAGATSHQILVSMGRGIRRNSKGRHLIEGRLPKLPTKFPHIFQSAGVATAMVLRSLPFKARSIWQLRW